MNGTCWRYGGGVQNQENLCLETRGKQLSWEMKRNWKDKIKTGLKERG